MNSMFLEAIKFLQARFFLLMRTHRGQMHENFTCSINDQSKKLVLMGMIPLFLFLIQDPLLFLFENRFNCRLHYKKNLLKEAVPIRMESITLSYKSMRYGYSSHRSIYSQITLYKKVQTTSIFFAESDIICDPPSNRLHSYMQILHPIIALREIFRWEIGQRPNQKHYVY